MHGSHAYNVAVYNTGLHNKKTEIIKKEKKKEKKKRRMLSLDSLCYMGPL